MKKSKKFLSLLLVVAMIFSLAVPVFAEGETATPATLASWVGGTSVTNNGEADVLSDVTLSMNDNGEGLNQYGSLGVTTSTYGNLAVQPWYGTNLFSETNYGYMEFTVATTGYTGLKLTTVLGNNGKAPIDYVVEVSTDGGKTWTPATEKVFAPEGKVNKLESAVTSTIDIPAAADDQTSVIFRVKQSAPANNANNAGNLYLYSLALTGTAKSATPDPEPGEYEGQTIILHSNDVHGAVDGYAYIAQLAKDYEEMGAEVIIADAGDYSQGNLYVNANRGADAVTMMNAAGYNVATVGNHEFDFGIDQLKANLKDAKYKTVCCNILDKDGNLVFDASTVITTESGLKIGFIGVNTPETQTKAHPGKIQGLKWLQGDEMVAAVQKAADDLEGKADVVIVLAHLGVDEESAPNRSTDLWAGLKKGSVDFIIDGHSHTVMDKGPANEPIQSTGTAFKNIGVISIGNESKAIDGNGLLAITSYTAKDETVAGAAVAITSKLDVQYGEKIGESKVDLNGAKAYNEKTELFGNRDGETNLGDLVTDAMLWAAKKNFTGLTVDEKNIVAITNGGGIRTSIKTGDITLKNVFDVLPFGNTLAVLYLTGDQLLEALEASTYCSPDSTIGGFPQVAGIKYTIDSSKAYDKGDQYAGSTYYAPKSIQRITIDSINGQAFDPKATYAVVTNDFLAVGGDTYAVFKEAEAVISDKILVLDEVLVDYIKTELKGVVGDQYKDPQGRINYVYEPFSDIEGWFHDYIIVAAAAGLVNGFPDGTFRPDENVTREQYITMLYRLFDTDEDKEGAELTFTDAGTIGYGKEAVSWGVANGVINGYTDNTFRPNAKITRAEMAAMTYRALCSVIGKEAADSHNVDAGFKDVVSGSYYETPVNVLAHMGIINGMGEGVYAPDGVATRAQAAKILASILVYFG